MRSSIYGRRPQRLPEAIEVMKTWGFEYKTCAVWNKETMGLGTWFRIQHELLLVGIKGNPAAPKRSLRKRSIFNIKRTKHSKKPQEFRDMINYWYPNEEKIELFAREYTWDGGFLVAKLPRVKGLRCFDRIIPGVKCIS